LREKGVFPHIAVADFLRLSQHRLRRPRIMFRKSLSALTVAAALGGSLLVPIAAQAKGVEHKVYDRSHKDYHNWNTDEDKYYRQYLNESHHKYHEFSKTSKKHQDQYWRWRHDHQSR
jgi:5-bromo-4-chloroindolyl phosphate hydrolysis protein